MEGVVGGEKLSWHDKWHRRDEPSYPGLLIWMLLEFAVQLAKLIISAVERVEGNQIGRIRGEIGGVFLVFGFGGAVFEFILRAM